MSAHRSNGMGHLRGANEQSHRGKFQRLRDNIADAPHDEIFRGMYRDYQFPRDEANPLEGFGYTEPFTNTLRTKFIGPASVFSKRSGGLCGKAAKNGMFSFNVHPWYRITNEAVDTCYNYDTLYLEVLGMLEDPLFSQEVQELLAYLNRLIFPHAHPHARCIRPRT
ncbi:hypothetical protein FRC06_001692 [Ceratobasidium sp. 370]|nr:hypothetical protein FRC06_001692 [Ceratobasidium sp. 370]